jgi:hypothetical protein
MYTPLNESLGKEKLTIIAGAATVGRPTGVDGKRMSPRRARVTKKELEKLNTKGLKAGGPGSGRHASYGKFKDNGKSGMIGENKKKTTYQAPMGKDTAQVDVKHNLKNDSVEIHESRHHGDERSLGTTSHTDDSQSASKLLKNRFGIDHTF